MSEVKENSVIYLAPACHEEHMQREWCEEDVWSPCEECGSGNTSVRYNLGADFDRVTAEREALQQRLNVADERLDLLEGLLRDALLYLPSHGMGGVTFELNKRIIDALKPVDDLDR